MASADTYLFGVRDGEGQEHVGVHRVSEEWFVGIEVVRQEFDLSRMSRINPDVESM